MEGATLRILFAAPAWWPAIAFGGPIPVDARACDAARRATATRRGRDHEPGRPPSRRRVRTRARRARRRRARPLPRDAGQLPLDGDHADAAARSSSGCERPDVVHVLGFRDVVIDGRRRVGAPPAHPVRVRAARDVPAAAAQGGAEAGARRDALPRGRRSGAGGRRRQLGAARRDDVVAGGIAARARSDVRGNGFPDPELDAAAHGGCGVSSASRRTRRSSSTSGGSPPGKGIEHPARGDARAA